jgi:hypothetical protein
MITHNWLINYIDEFNSKLVYVIFLKVEMVNVVVANYFDCFRCGIINEF